MSSKLEPVIWLRVLVTLAYMKGRTDVRMYVRTLYVRTDVHDVMAIAGFHCHTIIKTIQQINPRIKEIKEDEY